MNILTTEEELGEWAQEDSRTLWSYRNGLHLVVWQPIERQRWWHVSVKNEDGCMLYTAKRPSRRKAQSVGVMFADNPTLFSRDAHKQLAVCDCVFCYKKRTS